VSVAQFLQKYANLVSKFLSVPLLDEHCFDYMTIVNMHVHCVQIGSHEGEVELESSIRESRHKLAQTRVIEFPP
jgi:hypothetical protein